MPSVAQTLQRALQQHQAGDLGEAERTYRSIIRIDPLHPDALHLLGIIQQQRGDSTSAIDYIGRAIHANPQPAVFHSNLAAAHKALGEIEAARQCLEEAVRLDPGFGDAHYNLGTLLNALNEHNGATAALRQAVALDPSHADAHNNLGIAFAAQNDRDEAIACYRRAIICRPDHAEAYNNLGTALAAAGDVAAARECLDHALQIDPGYAQARVNLGNSCRDEGDAVTAEGHYRAALRLNSDAPDVWNNLGVALKDQGKIDEAQTCFDRVVAQHPDHPAARYNRGFTRLLQGGLSAGWADYEWRFRAESQVRQFSQPLWDGAPGRKLLIHTEQGIGDQIMFASCVSEIAQTSRQCTLECDPRLVPLLQRSLQGVSVIGESTETQSIECDAQIAIGSLPMFVRQTMESFPKNRSFLVPDSKRVRQWRQRFVDLPGKLKVGISWRGGRDAELQRQRTIALHDWAPILTLPGVCFVQLQYGECAAEIAEFGKRFGVAIHDWKEADCSNDLDGFSAQVAALDLVISIDNSTVHFAGGLGVACWTLLPFVPDWRWMLNRTDSVWYRSARLFRQPRAGDWGTVIVRVRDALIAKRAA